MENKYKNRVIDGQIAQLLDDFGAILIAGPKWCGKTSTAEYHSKSVFYVGDPEGNFSNRELAKMNPSLVLEGEYPRLIDEWQDAPSLWDAVKFKVDKNKISGNFILTGSATPKKKGVLHTGAGRIAKVNMRTMSLYEMGFSTGAISLKDICEGEIEKKMTGEVDLNKIIDYILIGGWPINVFRNDDKKVQVAKKYIDAIFDEEIFNFDGKKRNANKFGLFLKSIARNDNTMVSASTINKDIAENETTELNTDTISEYFDIVKRLYLVENIEPYSTKIRSSVRVRTSPKKRFVDPSITCALLNITKGKLLGDMETLGILFESLCYRDLLTYASANNYSIYHYHDYDNQEIDAICELSDSRYVAIEMKLGANKIDEAAENLLKFKNKIIADGKKPPERLVVLCGLSNACYIRDDGVYVVPITSLKN